MDEEEIIRIYKDKDLRKGLTENQVRYAKEISKLREELKKLLPEAKAIKSKGICSRSDAEIDKLLDYEINERRLWGLCFYFDRFK